jgi:hypothetical protein
LNEKCQYSALCLAIPAIDNPKVRFDLSKRFSVELARAFAFESLAIGTKDDHVYKFVFFDLGQSSMWSISSGPITRQVGMAQR